MKPKAPFLALPLYLLIVAIPSPRTFAANTTWLGNTDGNLGTAANWDTAPVSGDSWTFGAAGSSGATLANNLTSPATFEVAGISFGSASAAYLIDSTHASSFTLTGNIVSTAAANAVTIGSNIVVSGTRQISINGGATTANITLSGNLSGSGSLTQTAGGSGAKSVVFSGDNSGFSGTFTQNNDGNNRTAFNAAASGSASAAWTFNRNVNGGVALNFTGATINFGALSGGGYIRANTTGTVNVSVGALGTDTTFTGIFQQSNVNTKLYLTKVGGGMLTLSGANTHTAGTTVANGTIHATNAAAFGSGTVTIGDTSGSNSAGIRTNVGTTSIANNLVIAAGSSGVASITNVAGGGTTTTYSGTVSLGKDLTINAWGAAASGGSTAFSGAITGSGNLTVDGNNSAFGPIASLSNASNNINGDITIRNGGQLRTVNGALGAANRVTIGATSQLNTNGQSLTIAGLDGSGTVIVSNSINQVLTLAGSGTYDYAGGISGAGGLNHSGSGTQTLSGTSSYTGATIVSAGTLLVSGALGDSNITVKSGATVGAGDASGAIGGNLNFESGAKLDVSLGVLVMDTGAGLTFGGFDFSSLVGFDVETASEGTHTLIGGSGISIDPTNLAHWGVGNAYTRTDGKLAYFHDGSFAVTIAAVPEPAIWLLGCLGLCGLARRRR
ncbi:MAG: autotransporter-associated beta strand repeat-containing protein [Verrucomicrobia bacterium]|nr:autotransporter-associated beta strand repeat-containing protein [Verrucomicrobiota bacterium]